MNNNIYGQKNAGYIWNKYLVAKLINKLHFTQSAVDKCMFYHDSSIYLLYIDNSILAGPDKNELQMIIKDIKVTDLNITILGNLKDFLGVNINKEKDSRLYISQPHLINQITKQAYKTKATSRNTPAKSSEILL